MHRAEASTAENGDVWNVEATRTSAQSRRSYAEMLNMVLAGKQLVQVHRAEVAPGRKARGSPGKQLVQVHRAEDKLRALSAYLTIEATRTSAQSRNGNPLCLLGL